MNVIKHLIIFAFLLAACTTHTAKNDADAVTPDGDVPVVDDAVEAEADDFIFVEADELLTDADTVVCPSMKSYENVKAAGFPLKDTNGKITFCRPGCDTPTENDPQCVRNIWDWINWKHYQDYLLGKNGISYNYAECYPWPCVLPNVKSSKVSYSACDRILSSNDFTADSGELYDLRIEKGMVGMEAQNGISMRTVLYDVANDTFRTVAHSGHATGYRNERLIFYTISNDVFSPTETNKDLGNTYILSNKKTSTGYRYEAIYSDDQNQARFSRPPFVGEKWVVLNIEHRATNTYEVLYAKVDEWKWHKLNRQKVYEGNVVGDRLVFIDDSLKIFVCDLTKLPSNPDTDCLRIDRTGESVNDPRLNEENQNELVYHDLNKMVLLRVDISGSTPVYSELPYTKTETSSSGAYPDQFKGNIVLYSEIFYNDAAGSKDMKACFYRVDTKKQYCDTTQDPMYFLHGMLFNSFDGNYQLWKRASGHAYIRDLACYCTKEGVCPFEGLK